MNIYTLFGLFRKLRSPRVKLLGLYLLHVTGKRYLGVFFDPVLACNFRCKMCYFSDEEKRKSMHGSLTLEEIRQAANALFHRTLKLQIGCGAEPTLYKELEQIVRIGKEYGIPYISLTTNGNLLTGEKLATLVKTGLDEITISTHGIKKETYENLMTNGKFELFIRLLDNLKQVKQEYPAFKVRINYTMNADNIEELKDFWSLFNEVPFDVLQLRPIQEIGKSEYSNFDLNKISESFETVITPLIESCKSKKVICLTPDKSNLIALKEQTPDKNKIIEDLTYCYFSPNGCLNDHFDYKTESFETYSKRTKRGRYILKNLFGRLNGTIDPDKEVTRRMNYSIKQ